MPRFIRALAAFAALVAVGGGVPWVLLRWGHWPINGMPTRDQIENLPTTVLTDAAVFGVLTVAAWTVWALFMFSVLLEAIAELTGHDAPALPLATPLQRNARRLVAALLMTASVAGPLARAATAQTLGSATSSHLPPPPPAHLVAEFPSVPLSTSQEPTAGRPTPSPAPDIAPQPVAPAPLPQVEVRRGDNPWDLAEAHLADPLRWREIWELNRGAVQPDGRAWVTPDEILPGWVLQLPADAINLPSQAPEIAAGTYTVQAGDTLSEIADQELGDPARTTELFELNVGQPQPDGASLHDPDLIRPGWNLALPATSPPAFPTNGDQPAPSTTGEVTAPDALPAPTVDLPADPQTAPPPASLDEPAPAATTEAPPTTSREPEPVPAPPAPSSPAASATTGVGAAEAVPPPASMDEVDTPPSELADPGEEGNDDALPLPLGLVGGGVATAGLLLMLDRRRRAQQRHRRRGERVLAPPADLEHVEQQLRAGADTTTSTLVDVALRAAAAGAGSTGLPELAMVEATVESVTLVLTAPSPAPVGFVAAGAHCWRTAVPVHELEALGRTAASPAPTLCPVGTTDDGTEVLVDLEASGVTTVTGDPQQIVDLLRAVAIAAASTPWAGQSRVVLVGFAGDLTTLPQVESIPTLRDALDVGVDHSDQSAAALHGLGCPTIGQARASGATPDAWEPLIVVSATAPDDLDTQLLSSLAARPNHGVAVVCPVGTSPLPGRVIEIDSGGWLRMAGLDVGVRARQLAEDDTRVLADLLTRATDLHSTPLAEDMPSTRAAIVPTALASDHSAATAEHQSALDALRAEVDVLVRVLGDVDVVRLHPDGSEDQVTASKQKAIEAIAYLALREGTVDREDVQAALWPSGANSVQTFKNAIWEARRALGQGRDGLLLPQASGGRYDLSERVVTDYGLFYELTHSADETDDALAASDLLTEALTLVRGEPLVGVGRGYSWVGSHRGIIVAQIVDAAEELAEVRLATGDWRTAEWAARQGLRAMPCDERLYRLLMRTAHAAGNTPGVHQVFRELCDAVADPDTGAEPEDTLHPETIALYEELTSAARPHPGRVTA